jgi:flavodoxin
MNPQTSGRSLVILSSYHHHNTEEIASVIAEVLGAEITKPQDVNPAELHTYGLIGFGSGIYFSKHHRSVLKLAEQMPSVTGKSAFLFSTSGVFTQRKLARDHAALRDILVGKGYAILDEFGCRGWDTYSFLKYIGGWNKGRPNAKDLERARAFATNLQRIAPES